MRLFLATMFALAISAAPVAADPNGVRVNPNIILEPISEVPLDEAFHTPEFVSGGEGVLALWRFSYEEGAYDDSGWQAIGLIGISELGEGIEPVVVRVWARGEITSGDSSALTATRIAPPTGKVAAFLVQLSSTRGTATVTLAADGVVQIDGQRLGVVGR